MKKLRGKVVEVWQPEVEFIGFRRPKSPLRLVVDFGPPSPDECPEAGMDVVLWYARKKRRKGK